MGSLLTPSQAPTCRIVISSPRASKSARTRSSGSRVTAGLERRISSSVIIISCREMSRGFMVEEDSDFNKGTAGCWRPLRFIPERLCYRDQQLTSAREALKYLGQEELE